MDEIELILEKILYQANQNNELMICSSMVVSMIDLIGGFLNCLKEKCRENFQEFSDKMRDEMNKQTQFSELLMKKKDAREDMRSRVFEEREKLKKNYNSIMRYTKYVREMDKQMIESQNLILERKGERGNTIEENIERSRNINDLMTKIDIMKREIHELDGRKNQSNNDIQGIINTINHLKHELNKAIQDCSKEEMLLKKSEITLSDIKILMAKKDEELKKIILFVNEYYEKSRMEKGSINFHYIEKELYAAKKINNELKEKLSRIRESKKFNQTLVSSLNEEYNSILNLIDKYSRENERLKEVKHLRQKMIGTYTDYLTKKANKKAVELSILMTTIIKSNNIEKPLKKGQSLLFLSG